VAGEAGFPLILRRCRAMCLRYLVGPATVNVYHLRHD